jgi:peptidyl-prolyl cis-trans isomerase A (cyclophilin A)
MAAPPPDARISCPLCGGAVHPIAGRCKHCKGDLAALRTGRPTAVATLPSLVAKAAVPTFTPHNPMAPPDEPAPILPPRPTGRMYAAAPRAPRWPAIVIVLSVAATATAIGVLVWPSGGEPVGKREAKADPRPTELEKPDPTRPNPPPQQLDGVRAPIAADLGDYIGHLPKYGTLQARIDTMFGTINCELFPEKAPMTVANFVGLATGKKPWIDTAGNVQKGKPFYDGLTFHRVIADFMIQGGDPAGIGTGGPGYKFANEVDPDLVMESGTLAMANAGPDTNGSQFFIMEKEAAWLDGKHTIFGKCRDLHIVRRIARVQKSSSDKPVDPITMTVTISK